jgi:2-phospho-L-lactate guanylyltransferase
MPSPPSLSMWTVIVPVKQTMLAKTRLIGIKDDTRRALAIAFARDTVTAVSASSMVGRVVVVSNDEMAPAIAGDIAELIPDVPDAGLNPALVYAAHHVRARQADAAIAAVSSDLPALRGEDLTLALRCSPEGPWFVPDASGVGTTLLASPGSQPWNPSFGPGSRRLHAAAGVIEIDVAGLDRLRQDVDTADDLAAARRLGVGPSTAAVLFGVDDRRLA